MFLSEHDLFIQQNFFSNPQQVAWVYDPHTDEEGCFGWIGGNIEKLSAIRVGYSQSVEITGAGANDYGDESDDAVVDSLVRSHRENEPPEPAWLRWTSLVMGYLAAIVLGFVVGHQSVGASSGSDHQHDCRELYQRVVAVLCPLPALCRRARRTNLLPQRRVRSKQSSPATAESSRGKRKQWQALTTNLR